MGQLPLSKYHHILGLQFWTMSVPRCPLIVGTLSLWVSAEKGYVLLSRRERSVLWTPKTSERMLACFPGLRTRKKNKKF
jgi:hypothetical protein